MYVVKTCDTAALAVLLLFFLNEAVLLKGLSIRNKNKLVA